MASLKKIPVVWLLLAVLGMLPGPTAGAISPPSLACGGWRIVPSPNPSTTSSVLSSVAAVSASDAWAVGGSGTQPLIQHWNGSQWSIVSSPSMNGGLGSLAVLSATNIWAVGYRGLGTLIEHWDGVQWKIIPSPNRGSYLNGLGSVSALSPSDIWAVGGDELGSGSQIQTLIEHWNGATWSIVASPNMGSYNSVLVEVSALSPTDVWAVGDYSSAQRPYVAYPLSQHWDGQRWKIIHVLSTNGSGFTGVAAITAKDIWAVGRGPSSNTLTQRWNGRTWQLVFSPNPSLINNSLLAVAGRSRHDIWAVGDDLKLGQTNLFATLAEHWDGTRWQVVPSPNVSGQDNYLNGVAVVAPHGVWAVGYAMPHNGYTSNTLIEYYC